MKSILFIVITLATVAPAQISNVHQKGEDGHVVITYDLSGEEGKTYNVFVTATSADGDTIIPRAIVGDVHKVSPGRNLSIRWEAQAEVISLIG